MELVVEKYMEYAVEQGNVVLHLFIAGGINVNMDLEFTSLNINGTPVFPIKQTKQPQGVSLRIGTFEQGEKVLLAWKFHTHIISEPTDVVIGVLKIPGNVRTILEKRSINAFEDYVGTAVITA